MGGGGGGGGVVEGGVMVTRENFCGWRVHEQVENSNKCYIFYF